MAQLISMNEILVVIVPWDKANPVSKYVSNNILSLQEIVGGYLEIARRIEDFAFVVNEEGDLRQLPRNRGLYAGDFFVAKTNGSEFVSMSEDDAKRWIDMFDFEKRIIRLIERKGGTN